MHGVQLHLSFDSINLQFFEYAFLNESSVTSWVEHCINHLSSFGVVMLVYSNWNKHRICDGIGGFSSITGTCTAATAVEKLLALLTLLPLLLLLVVLVNSFFLASLRASGENTGSVARDASCVTNLTTS